MNHRVDTNDVEFVEKRYGKVLGWVPDVRGEHGKINPHITRFVLSDWHYVTVFHIKPVYYETIVGTWRPLSEVTTHYGNHRVSFTFEGIKKVHPRYINWLEKRMQLINGTLEVESPFSDNLIKLSPFIQYVHDTVMVPKFGLTTSTFYPDPSAETTSVDGCAWQYTPSSNFATLRAAAGGSGTDTSTDEAISRYYQLMSELLRSFHLFDTSSIGSDTVNSGTVSVYATSRNTSHSPTQSIDLVDTNPASNTAIVAGDYDSLVAGTAQSGEIDLPNFTLNAYNDFSLNATGISNVNGSGITKFGFRMKGDVDNIGPASGSSYSNINARYADYTGTTSDPKLVVDHTATAGGGGSAPYHALSLLGVG